MIDIRDCNPDQTIIRVNLDCAWRQPRNTLFGDKPNCSGYNINLHVKDGMTLTQYYDVILNNFYRNDPQFSFTKHLMADIEHGYFTLEPVFKSKQVADPKPEPFLADITIPRKPLRKIVQTGLMADIKAAWLFIMNMFEGYIDDEPDYSNKTGAASHGYFMGHAIKWVIAFVFILWGLSLIFGA